MAVDPGSIEHLTEIISHVVGPSFLLGAVASFISMVMGRMNGVIERIRDLNAIPADDATRATLKEDLPRLHLRVKRLQQSLLLGIGSGIVTTLLIIVAFMMAFASYHHGQATGVLFIVALSFFFGSLVLLAMEVMISVSQHDHY